MAEGSPELYQRRKHGKLEIQQPRPTFETNALSSHFRPHRTIPELVEHYPAVWLPPPTPPTPTPTTMTWDSGDKWDSGLKWK